MMKCGLLLYFVGLAFHFPLAAYSLIRILGIHPLSAPVVL